MRILIHDNNFGERSSSYVDDQAAVLGRRDVVVNVDDDVAVHVHGDGKDFGDLCTVINESLIGRLCRTSTMPPIDGGRS